METDSLYYIMDYSGHYYRTNKADQLVAVAGEQDATVFTFAQANSRICVGKKAAFYCMVPIEENVEDMSREVSGSDEILWSCLPHSIRYNVFSSYAGSGVGMCPQKPYAFAQLFR